MAMHEERGYSPYNELIKYDMNEKVSEKWSMVRNYLGERLKYILYWKSDYCYKKAYVIDVLKYSTGVLGIEVGCAIEELMPKNEKNFSIICKDVLNPYQIPANIQENGGEWVLNTQEESEILCQDERYLVVIQKKVQEIYMYLYKK